MPSVSVLPKLFHWLFAFLEFVFVLGVVVICAALLANPKLPPARTSVRCRST